MVDELVRYEITPGDERKNKLLKVGAVTLPVVGAILPALAFFVPFLFASSVATAGMFLILSLIGFGVGLIAGGIGAGMTMAYRSRWLSGVRERVAIDGIRTEEVRWFWNELKGEEKRALKEIEQRNLLLADAYQETLASRLTATRIVKSTNYELVLAKRRKSKLKYLKSGKIEKFSEEIERDIKKLSKIKTEAKEMEVEAESRLQMIDAASRRGSELAGTELALKKLTARSEQLPLALEAAKMEEEIRRELEEETSDILD